MESSTYKNNSAIAKVIRGRRAIKEGYTDKEVKEEVVRGLLQDAIWAPTHGMRQPWRFIFIDQDSRADFAKKVGATYPEALQQNREAYLNTPNSILVVIMEEPAAQKQWEENYGATASMIQNFWLLAWEQELGVCWKTNPHIADPLVKEILNVTDTEKVVGFIHLGYFDEEPEKKDRIPVVDKFERYQD